MPVTATRSGAFSIIQALLASPLHVFVGAGKAALAGCHTQA